MMLVFSAKGHLEQNTEEDIKSSILELAHRVSIVNIVCEVGERQERRKQCKSDAREQKNYWNPED